MSSSLSPKVLLPLLDQFQDDLNRRLTQGEIDPSMPFENNSDYLKALIASLRSSQIDPSETLEALMNQPQLEQSFETLQDKYSAAPLLTQLIRTNTISLSPSDKATVLEGLIAMKVSPSGPPNNSPLMSAISMKNEALVKILIEAGADLLQSPHNFQKNCLHHALKINHTPSVLLLCEAGVDLEQQDMMQWRPIHWATYQQGTENTYTLLQYPIDINAITESGSSALFFLKSYDPKAFPSLLEAFAAKGADLNHQDHYGSTLLHHLIQRGELEMIQCLLSYGVDLALMDKKGLSPLHLACQLGHTHLLQPLIAAGADAFLTNSQGLMPRDLAADHHAETVKAMKALEMILEEQKALHQASKESHDLAQTMAATEVLDLESSSMTLRRKKTL